MIRTIRTELTSFSVDVAAVLLWLLCAPFYALGWLAGLLVRGVLWIVAAMIAGYKQGRGL